MGSCKPLLGLAEQFFLFPWKCSETLCPAQAASDPGATSVILLFIVIVVSMLALELISFLENGGSETFAARAQYLLPSL